MFIRHILLSSLHEYSMALSSDPTVPPPQSYGFAVKISHQTCCRFRESQTKTTLLRLNTQVCAVRLIIYSSRQWRSEALASGALIGRVGSHGPRAQSQGIGWTEAAEMLTGSRGQQSGSPVLSETLQHCHASFSPHTHTLQRVRQRRAHTAQCIMHIHGLQNEPLQPTQIFDVKMGEGQFDVNTISCY